MLTNDATQTIGLHDIRVLGRRRPPDAMRDEIAASWSRCRRIGVSRDHLSPQREATAPGDDKLVALAAPVLDRAIEDLPGAVCLVLTASNGLILDRRVGDPALGAALDAVFLDRGYVWSEQSVGTNGIGTAIERQRPIVVRGRENYAQPLRDIACATTPFTDPRTGRLIGAVGLVCSVAASSALMLPYVRRVGRDIESRLLDGTSVAERILLDHFVRARLRCRGPILAIDERNMTTNAAAARIVSSSDHPRLWECARRAVATRRPTVGELMLTNGANVVAHCKPAVSGNETVGVLVRLESRDPAKLDERAKGRRMGLSSLSAAQLGVAELVAAGLTNREAAARLYVSRHTIDFHLRQIYNKLRISSRVELARLVAERHAELSFANEQERAAI